MLKGKSLSEIQRLVEEGSRAEVRFLLLPFKKAGTLILVDTKNGSRYLLEVESRWKSTAHIFRLQGGRRAPLGYRGVRELLPLIIKGLDFRREGARDTSVTRIWVLNPEPKPKKSRGRSLRHA